MKRIIMICEGPTEQAFAKNSLVPHFIKRDIYFQTPLIKASHGGIVKWPRLKEQIETHFIQDKEAYVTTFIDYYGTYSKHQFPGWELAHKEHDKNLRLNCLEENMLNDINKDLQHRFIPYLQLHEFEGLLFTNIEVIKSQIPSKDLVGIDELEKTFLDYPNPETINNNKATSPSHRLERIIRGYN